MSRNTKAAKAAATTGLNLLPELLEQLIPGQVTKANFEDVFAHLKRAMIERVLGGELTHHLGYAICTFECSTSNTAAKVMAQLWA
jgi:transposase-like protein